MYLFYFQNAQYVCVYILIFKLDYVSYVALI